jgi:hypothetical protein
MSIKESVLIRKSVRRYKDTCIESNILIEIQKDKV